MKKSDLIGKTLEQAKELYKGKYKPFKCRYVNGEEIFNTMELYLGPWLTIENDVITEIEGGVFEEE